MPIARFQMPDGRVARFEVPEGTTPEQAQSLMQNYAASMPAPKNPTEGNGFLDNAAAGLGSAIADIGLRGKQAGAWIADKAVGGNRSARVEQEIADKRELDAPLMATGGGKVGNIAGKAAPALAAAFVPGGQTLTGSILAGMGTGLLEPVAAGESGTVNALLGGAGGAAGYGVGKGVAAVANKLTTRAAEKAAANSVKDATAVASRQAGYVIPPSQTNPTVVNRLAEGVAGKISTGQGASIKNQTVTNNLVAKELGLPVGQPIRATDLAAIRANAGQAYDAVSSAGVIRPTQAYSDALDNIVSPYVTASKSFPEAAPNPIIGKIDELRTPEFDAASAVAKIRTLRADADAAYGAGNKELGKSLKSAAGALEDAIDSHLQAVNAPANMLKDFREARKLIAKTYSVQGALNDSTGNVAARKLATQLAKGRPLSGELEQVARFAQAFPKAADEVSSSMPGLSPLDFGLTLATGNPLALVARPAARSVILSKPYQAAMGTPSYGGNQLLNLLASQPGQATLQASGSMMLPKFAK